MSISKRAFIHSAVVTFLLIATVCGAVYAAAPMRSSDVGMVGCPFAGHGSAVCDMSPLEHIALWQNLLTAVPTQDVTAMLLLLLALFLLAYPVSQFRFPVLIPQSVRACHPHKAVPHDPLQRFIARGLLHPKLF